ncbi:MAG TPA: ATP-binding protein [Gemmatimonadaceae bacterium]|nr:ATP-binding protein [Gemmatimonadaceae bacterium]
MTTVINVPPSLDDATFEQVLEQLAPLPADAKILVDARHARWATPYGLAALLTLAQSRAERPGFTPPEADETASYWARAGFFRFAEQVFDLHGSVPRGRPVGESEVLLEITPVAKSDDVHEVVGRIQQKAQAILVRELNLDPKATMGFAMTLSEACQNIVEHAGRGGWVAVQTYRWKKRLGRRVVVIAVCDAGVGFRQSLESAPGRPRSDRWDDAMALEEAVIRGVSRFRDPGRGQGLAGVRRYIGRWDGKLSVRSGTARIAIVPSWDDDVPLVEKLAPFPGAQMQITIPERVVAR